MKYNRLNEIELYLSQKQYASIEDLLEKFNISLQTLRRDLKELQARGIITKVYGGVLFKRGNSVQLDLSQPAACSTAEPARALQHPAKPDVSPTLPAGRCPSRSAARRSG